MFTIKEVLHASLLVQDTLRSLEFYQRVLGLEMNTARPDLGYPGAWLQVGRQQIHLMELPNPDPMTGRPVHGGRDRHIALDVSDVDELRKALDMAGIAYTRCRTRCRTGPSARLDRKVWDP